MTTLPRTITAGELTKLRSDNQSSRVYLTIHKPATVYDARLAAVPTSTDQVMSITYNTGNGDHTKIIADQTLYVGTIAGAYDLGMCRIRNTTDIGATSGTFNIGETSEINWQSNCYLTVKDEFAIWPRHIKMDGTTPYIDDITYTDQNSACDSIPVMGPHRFIWRDNDADEVSLTLDGSDSWAMDNSITGYAWACSTASSSSGTTTATPTFNFDTFGCHRVSLTVTNSDGKSFTGYRYIFIDEKSEDRTVGLDYDFAVVTDFTLDSLSGDYSVGGWTAQVTIYNGADISDIRDRALVIIHTKDTYGTSTSSLGFVGGAENTLFVGWIAGETIRRAADDLYSTVSFAIEGTQYWLGRIPAFPVGFKNSVTVPSKWTRYQNLSAKSAVWHMLHWRTTATRCTDVLPLDNTYLAARIEAPGAQTLWEQLSALEYQTVLAHPCADRLGRLFNHIEQQLLDDTDRAAIPTPMTLTTQDIAGEVEIERSVVDEASIIDLSGFSYDGTTGTAYFSLSPGAVFRHYGSAPEVVDRLVLYDQATTNTLCGRYAGWRNNLYPRVAMLLASNHRLIDIAPYSFYDYALATADTPRGISGTLSLIPRRMSYEYNNANGYFLVRAEFEAEAETALSITGDAPEVIPSAPPPPPPPPPPPVIDPMPQNDASEVWFYAVGQGIVWSGDFFNGGQPTWNLIDKDTDLPYVPNSLAIKGFGISLSATAFYISGAWNVSGTTRNRLYKCTNASSVRVAPGLVAPVWSSILAEGDTITTNAGSATVNNTTINLTMYGNNLITCFSADYGASSYLTYGIYDGSTWTFTKFTATGTNLNYGFTSDRVVASNSTKLYNASSVQLDTWTTSGTTSFSAHIWRNLISSDTYFARHKSIGGGLYEQTLRKTGADCLTFPNSDAANALRAAYIRPRGAWSGSYVYVVDPRDGQLYASTNGTTFSAITGALFFHADTSGQVVMDGNLAGNGSLVWIMYDQANANVFIRISNDAGLSWDDMVGDYWTDIQTTGALEIIDAWLAYP